MLSAVLRITRGDSAVLIGGDAPLGSWERLDGRNPELLRAEAIRVPHHCGHATEGGTEWTEYEQLYTAVNAKLSVVSVGTNNGYEHPQTEHLVAARRGGQCRLICTQLTPRCHHNPPELREAMKDQATMVEPPYRHWDEDGKPRSTEVPCAGSVVAWIDAGGKLHHEPSAGSEHSKLLLRVDGPLCQQALD
ncbi:hypothetical protein ENSA7_44120 [Enhygromyxa salina]|uniref:Uncharacterized protein n=1 Tax=Enhygromyxa salina TaxID=215803 RepID=A0A2S9YKR6_9BACT|nr:hypothetical protein ENSA7_44120 [Enhygromyxa salina]